MFNRGNFGNSAFGNTNSYGTRSDITGFADVMPGLGGSGYNIRYDGSYGYGRGDRTGKSIKEKTGS